MVSSGKTVGPSCKLVGCDPNAFRNWVVQDFNGLAALYARAREQQFDAWAEQILDLADMVRQGTRKVTAPDGSVTVFTADQVDRAKLQIDARKWLLSKLKPKQYGEHTPQAPVLTQSREIVVNPFGRRILPGAMVNGSNGHGNGTNGNANTHTDIPAN